MTTLAARPPLERARTSWLGGVAAGLARHLGRPVGIVRVELVLLALLGGAGVLLYLWLWALVPLEAGEEGAPPAVRRRIPVAVLLTVLAGSAALVAIVCDLAGLGRTPLVPGLVESALAAAGVVAWTLFADRADTGRPARQGTVLRTIAAIFLIVEGGVLLIGQREPLTAVLAVFLVVLGVLILVIPRLVALWSELIGERAARAREEQRAEIAAHLHDSVLQTLALIQSRAGAQSEVARLARAQERELRDWLFAGTDPFAGDIATELRTTAAALELEHAVRIEVVTAGDLSAVVSGALAAASREAMLNAAQHAGGDVTVYAEATPDAVEVFVRDRGPGFDPDAVPDGRFGIRESIVRRMARAGGSATVASDAEGTEVQLRLPLPAGRAES